MLIQELMNNPNIGTVYIDMDGVVAGCDQATADFNGIPLETYSAAGYSNQYWKNMLATADMEKFFAEMGYEKNAEKLLGWFETNNVQYTFLTRPVREPNVEACIKGKNRWLAKKGLATHKVIFEFDKEKYAVTNGIPNILIDDHSGNIEKWIEAGGIGIHYRHFWCDEVLKKLQTLLFPVNEASKLHISELKLNSGATTFTNDNDRIMLKRLQRDCSDFISSMDGRPLYRGFTSSNLPKSFITTTRDNRVPKNMPLVAQQQIDSALSAEGFTALRSNSIFCSGGRGLAESYGALYYIFPINGFSFTWSRMTGDLWRHRNSIRYELDKGSAQFVEYFKFSNTDMGDAIKSYNEIYIHGRYIALNFYEWNATIRHLFPNSLYRIDYHDNII